ncbi:MAG TPA: EAL domain-containing protein [Solirubrobacteraceae bacterium]|nr:EAL domain-containing protein [Solirubrobacteraceae bacterium]
MAVRRVRELLPRGRTLPDAEWERRHRALLWLLWAQAVALAVYGLFEGYGAGHTLLHVGGVAGAALLASFGASRRWRSALVSLGFMTAASLAVHISGGVIEAHFYFFVAIVALTLYEDWLPFLLAVVYVVLHHGIMGSVDPGGVYAHADAVAHPWRWALIHGAFVTAAGVMAVAAWRLNEQSRSELSESLSLLEATLQSTADGILVVDHEGRIVSSNEEFARMWRIPAELIAAGDDGAVLSYGTRQVADPEKFHAKVLELYDDAEAESFDVVEFSDGRVFERYSRPQRVDGRAVGRVWSFHDATERRRFEDELKHLADHDALTGLFNRRRFEQELDRELARAMRYEEPGAVLMLDVDNFKYVNDTLGHAAGDQIISGVAKLLDRRLRDTDAVARLGGDEFALVLPRTTHGEATRLAGHLLQAIREHDILVAGRSVHVTASIGVAVFDRVRQTASEVLAAADLAMYEAKDSGRDRVVSYSQRSGDEARRRVQASWMERIRAALEDERFTLYCQPILDVRTDEVARHELLVRMVGEDGEIIPPAAFLATAERFGLIQSLDRWVVGQAIALMEEQRQAGRRLRLEVNLSGRSVDDPDLPELIQRELAATSVEPGDLTLEITETALISNMDDARRFAETLTRIGCRFALDDFGTGFGSYYYLKHLPLHFLKIDGDFIRNLPHSPTDQLMVKAMVQVAQGLGMKTIAEFVEDRATLERLREFGVDYAQGYYVGRPVPVEAAWPLGDPQAARAQRGADDAGGVPAPVVLGL